MRHPRRLAAGTLAVALAIGLPACGGDDADSSSATESSGEASAPSGAEGEVQAGGDGPEASGTVEIGAVDFEFTDVPSGVEVGTRFVLRNDAATELHELVAFRLDDDETRTIEEIVALPPDEMPGVLGEPKMVILTPPGTDETIVAVGDGTLSEPGRHVLLCFIPTGVDVDEYLSAAATADGPPEVGDGPPHIAHGMYAEIEVR